MKTHAPLQTNALPRRDLEILPNKVAQAKMKSIALDNRSPIVALRQLANNNPRVMQLHALTDLINKKTTMPALRQHPYGSRRAIAQLADAGNDQTTQATITQNNTGLPTRLKSGIESLSGMSMDHVKVHFNSSKPAQLNAHAYAQGSEIHMAPGQERHLPHEAWHIVQQQQGRVQPTMQLKDEVPINNERRLEEEADVMGARAMTLSDHHQTAGVPIQRNSALASIQFAGDSDSEEEVDPSTHAEFDRAAHNEFLKNPIYRGWVDQILQDGSVNVSTSVNDPYAPRACWNSHSRQILIQQKFGPSPRRASMMAFEVTNAYQDNKNKELNSQARSGAFEGQGVSGDTLYARQAERIEYDGLVLHHTMMQWGIINLGWPHELDTYAERLGSTWSTFEGYLETQERSGHTNMHRSNYNQSLNPNRV